LAGRNPVKKHYLTLLNITFADKSKTKSPTKTKNAKEPSTTKYRASSMQAISNIYFSYGFEMKELA
jgi:hypothetical protein